MMTNSKLLWMTSGNTVFAISQASVMLLIAKYLGPADVGSYSFAISALTPILLFANLGLRNQLMSDVAHVVPLSSYLSLRRVTTLFGLIVSLGFASLIHPYTDLLILIIILGVAKAVEGQSDLVYGSLQRSHKHKVIGTSLILRSVIGTVLVAGVIVLTGSLFLACAALGATWLGVYLWHDRPQLIRDLASDQLTTLHPTSNPTLTLVSIGLPLGFSSMLISSNMALPRLTLAQTSGLAELGIFASFLMLMQTGSLLITSIGQTIGPVLADAHHKSNKTMFVRLSAIGLLTAGAVGVLGLLFSWLLGSHLLNLLFNSQFASNSRFLVYIFAIAPIHYINVFCSYIIVATRKTAPLLYIHIGSLIATLMGCLLLVPEYGIGGAIASILFSAIAACIGVFIVLVKIVRQF